MQRRVILDKNAASLTIASEVHQLLHVAANITGMTYRCNLTNHTLACINTKDIRLSWMQDGGEENLQRLAWIFYYYGTELYRLGRSSLSHGEWVEQKVLWNLNVAYVHLNDIPIGQTTCVQQLYAKKFSDLRTNILRRHTAFRHASAVKKEQPKVAGLFKKHFKRGKSTFFVSLDVQNSQAWHKVSHKLVSKPSTYHPVMLISCSGGLCYRS